MEQQSSSSSSKLRHSKHQEYEGQYAYKIYIKLLNQLLTQNKETIYKYLPTAQTEKDPSKVFKPHSDCPIFTKNLQSILDCFRLKKEIYQQTIEELANCIKIQVDRLVFGLKDQEIRDYRAIIEDNQKLFKQRMKQSQSQFIWTVQRMLIIDVLSSFMKTNYRYRKIHKTKGSVIGNRFLCKAFDIKSDFESKLYAAQFRTYFQFIEFPYQQDFAELILLCCIVEMKFKISGFRKKQGKEIAFKVQSQIKASELQQSQKMQQQQSNEQNNEQISQYPLQEYQYKLCQLIFISALIGEDLHKKSPLHKAQLKVVVQNLLTINNIPQRKRQLLKIKLKYSVTFQSLFRFVESQKKKQRSQLTNQEFMNNLEKVQWGFLKYNQRKIFDTLRQILRLQFITSSNLMNDKSILMTNLCRITMKRIALLTNANKAHLKIDTFLKRQSIYIYKLEFPYSDYSKKAQQEDKDDENDQKIFTIVLATTQKEIVYAAMFQCKLNEYQFARVIKIATKQANLDHFSIFFYIIFDLKPFNWHHISSLFAIRHYYDVRLYFSTSPQLFIIHFCIYHLISMLIKKSKPKIQNFMIIAVISALTIINAFAGSAKARQMCSQINHLTKQFIYQGYYEQFEQQKMQNRVRRIFKSLQQELNRQKYPQNRTIELFKKGKLYFFSNKNSQQYEVDDNQIHLYKRLSSFKPVTTHEEQQFIQRLIYQMKCRHPYLTKQQQSVLYEDIYPILCNKNLKKKDLIHILSAVVRFLLCYQIYFIQMTNRGQLKDLPDYLSHQFSFLIRIYQTEQFQLSQLFPNLIPDFVNNYFCMDYLTGQKISRVYRKLQHHNRQANQELLEKTQHKSEQQTENKKNQTNLQLNFRKKKLP